MKTFAIAFARALVLGVINRTLSVLLIGLWPLSFFLLMPHLAPYMSVTTGFWLITAFWVGAAMVLTYRKTIVAYCKGRGADRKSAKEPLVRQAAPAK